MSIQNFRQRLNTPDDIAASRERFADAELKVSAMLGGTARGEAPSEEQRAVNNLITDEFVEAGRAIELYVTDCREKSIALTHLETAKMFAVKAVFA